MKNKYKYKVGDRVIIEYRDISFTGEVTSYDSLGDYFIKVITKSNDNNSFTLSIGLIYGFNEKNIRLDTQYYRELRLKELLK